MSNGALGRQRQFRLAGMEGLRVPPTFVRFAGNALCCSQLSRVRRFIVRPILRPAGLVMAEKPLHSSNNLLPYKQDVAGSKPAPGISKNPKHCSRCWALVLAGHVMARDDRHQRRHDGSEDRR